MSRAHMLYNDTALDSTSSSLVDWPSKWEEPAGPGVGVLMEAQVQGKPARVTITDSSKTKHRYMVLRVSMLAAFNRQQADGKEVEVVPSADKKVSTGYLNSSYKDVNVRSDIISEATAHRRLDPILGDVRGKGADLPAGRNFEFWGDEALYADIDFCEGSHVRLKTKGDSPFLETIATLEHDRTKTATNFAGDGAVGESWTSKIQTKGGAAAAAAEPLPQDELEGVDDDEWDD